VTAGRGLGEADIAKSANGLNILRIKQNKEGGNFAMCSLLQCVANNIFQCVAAVPMYRAFLELSAVPSELPNSTSKSEGRLARRYDASR
jgi:hypothetical protein